jgi:hypothetical protein
MAKAEAKTNKASKATAAEDTVSVEDKKRLERQKRKDELLRDIAWLDIRKDALGEERDKKSSELRMLMSEDGESLAKNDYAGASFNRPRSFKVHTPANVLKLFPNKTLEETALFLAEKFKPNAEFVDGAAAAGLPVESAITIGYDERFEVKRAQTKEKKEWVARMVEAARQETEVAIKAQAEAILAGSKKGAK